jgi:hypothetical protein
MRVLAVAALDVNRSGLFMINGKGTLATTDVNINHITAELLTPFQINSRALHRHADKT